MAIIKQFKTPKGKNIEDMDDKDIDNIVELQTNSDSPHAWSVQKMLRTIADDIDAGDLVCDGAVLVLKGNEFSRSDVSLVIAKLDFEESVYTVTAAQHDLLIPDPPLKR